MNVMNHLQVIKQSMLKRQALYNAQMLHLKTYRGVPYVKVANEPVGHHELSYRGSRYTN